MISKKIAIDVLNTALQTGCDFAEIYLEDNVSSSINMDNGKVEDANDGITYGAGIRLLKNLQSVYGYTNDISRKGLLNLASTLSKSFDGQQEVFVETKIKQIVGTKHLP